MQFKKKASGFQCLFDGVHNLVKKILLILILLL